MTAVDTDAAEAVTEQHAATIVESSFSDHPRAVRDLARRAVVDGLANVLLARETPLGRTYRDGTTPIDDGVPIVGGGARSPVDAAYATAGLWNALDWDDTVEGAGHPGASVVPTAFAVGHATDASIESFLDAVVLGYELSIRSARALAPSWERYDLVHGSGTRHALGAAAAAAAVADLSIDETAELLGCAAQQAPVPHAGKFGWDEERLTWLKDNVARAASSGVRAWQLIDNGFAGPRTVLDGDRGFWRMAGSDQCDWDTLAAPLTDDYRLPDLAFKPYPCCRWLHATVEATQRAAADRTNITAADVETTERVADSFTIPPSNQVNAEFSLPFAVEQAIAGRDPVAWYDPDGPTPTSDVDVSVTADSTHTRRFETDHVAGATVTVTGIDGSETAVVERPRGGHERPLDAAFHDDKLTKGIDQTSLETDVQTVRELLSSDEPLRTLGNELTT